jgi:hypothetical protein
MVRGGKGVDTAARRRRTLLTLPSFWGEALASAQTENGSMLPSVTRLATS